MGSEMCIRDSRSAAFVLILHCINTYKDGCSASEARQAVGECRGAVVTGTHLAEAIHLSLIHIYLQRRLLGKRSASGPRRWSGSGGHRHAPRRGHPQACPVGGWLVHGGRLIIATQRHFRTRYLRLAGFSPTCTTSGLVGKPAGAIFVRSTARRSSPLKVQELSLIHI